MKTLNLRNFLDLKKSFEPDYQSEQPAFFQVCFDHYMKSHFDFDRHPERYLSVARDAYEYANKAVLYDRLGVSYEDNRELLDSDVFKSKFSELCSNEEDLMVKSGKVFIGDSLQKSLSNNGDKKHLNKRYEELWLKTNNSL